MSSAVSGHIFQTSSFRSLQFFRWCRCLRWSDLINLILRNLVVKDTRITMIFCILTCLLSIKMLLLWCISIFIDDIKLSLILILTNNCRLQSSILHSIDRLKCATFCTLVINAKVCSLCCLSNVLCIIDLPELSL